MDNLLISDVVFVIEETALNGAYINELKSNYILPTLEHFSTSGPLGDPDCVSKQRHVATYCIVLYKTTENLLESACCVYGPFASPQEVLTSIEHLPLVGGYIDHYDNMAEGLATAHCCFDDMQKVLERTRMERLNLQRHCILICTRPPCSMPVMRCWKHSGQNVEQLATHFLERKINFSIMAPRMLPQLIHLFRNAKNFAKNRQHMVLLNGYQLEQRPPSPNANNEVAPPQNQQQEQSGLRYGTDPGSQLISDCNNPYTGTPRVTQQQQQQQNQNAMQIQNFQENMAVNHQHSWVFQYQQQHAQQLQQHPQTVARPESPCDPGPSPVGMPMAAGGGPNQFVPGQNPNLVTNHTINPALLLNQMMNQQQLQQLQQHQQSQNPQAQQLGTNIPCGPNSAEGRPNAPNPTPDSSNVTSSMREREKIWSGLLEWNTRPNPNQQKITFTVQCDIATNVKDGEPEIKAKNWPPKLLMQLMPKHLVSVIGGHFLKDSKMVIFKPTACEALDALTKVMTTGFAGCLHFSTAPPMPVCEIKVLILLYTAEKNVYLGFIPTNQTLFVERLRKVIHDSCQSTLTSAPTVPSTRTSNSSANIGATVEIIDLTSHDNLNATNNGGPTMPRPITIIDLCSALSSEGCSAVLERDPMHQPATSKRRLKKSDEPDMKCPVCLEKTYRKDPTFTKCGHLFCAQCIREATRLYQKCPMCQKKLTKNMLTRAYLS